MICYDSMCAKNITTKVWNPRKNKGIAKQCQDALSVEHERRTGGVHFVHVKGHSEDKGNDKADDRVQWGKEDGPYCRFRSDGSFEGDYINSPKPSTSKLSTAITPSPSFRFSISSSYTKATAPKARRQLFDTSISPVNLDPNSTLDSSLTYSPASTQSEDLSLSISSTPECLSCNSRDVNTDGPLHPSTTRRGSPPRCHHSYNTRFQSNVSRASHPPESCVSLNKG